jgi:hypothetical protein
VKLEGLEPGLGRVKVVADGYYRLRIVFLFGEP